METNTTPAPAPKRTPRKTGKTVAKAPAKSKAAPTNGKGKIALKTICSNLKVEPKAARRKLRKSELAFHALKDRWMFTAAQAERVKEILQPN